ncbi:MAG: class I SAM-dependent methyltransferase [Acidobacteria bacterium]|nr:class I SAM-dependent methyltransferase [Acidobacteriota bacterium]
MDILEQYFAKLAAAFVRGKLASNQENYNLPSKLSEPLLGELVDSELCEIVEFGLASGLRLHKFKRTMGLARVSKVLGILQGLSPINLLDIGSGRGTFLWPMLDTFPDLLVTSIDQDPIRVNDIQAVNKGGVTNLEAKNLDVTELDFKNKSFDVITMLEVLEHIPRAQEALTQIVRVAKRFVIISVPSKEDNNPEHLHLFNQERLKSMFEIAGTTQVRFEYVLNHIIAVAKVVN